MARMTFLNLDTYCALVSQVLDLRLPFSTTLRLRL